jgi:hypothetical protein
MKKVLIFLILFIALINQVSAIPSCVQETTIPCYVVSPVIECDTYNYSLIDKEGIYYQNGTLELLGDGVYRFIMENVTINNVYTAILCSNQSTQITVIPFEAQDIGKGSIFLGLIISQIAILFVFIYFSYILSEEYTVDQFGNKVEKYVVLRVLLIFISFIWVYKIYNALSVIIQSYIGMPDLILLAGMQPYTWIFVTFASVYLFISLFYILRIIKTNKVNSLAY